MNLTLTHKDSTFEEMKDHFPSTVYKYRGWNNEFDKRVLTHKELFFASPRSFEDPLDCKQTVRYEELTIDEKLDWIEYQLRRDNDNWSDITIKNRALKIYEKAPIRNKETAMEITDKNLEEYFDITGVLSVTKNPNNELMWLKYADCHKGFCVGFDSKILFESGLIGSGSKVFYVKELPEIKPEPVMTSEEQRIKQIFFKEDKWLFEDEYRLHIFRDKKLEIEDRRIYPPVKAFKEILIGKDMPKKDYESLIEELPEDIKHVKIIKL
ncbi:MAG: DUF2971 domain-containing protein [Bacteroidetes bacterium]|nr:DUF2971 domain-containing protein [Bacteroidota bacterium]